MRIRTPLDLGLVIRERRRELGLDQQTLAKRVGASRQWIIGVEKGKSRAELGLVLRALDALGLRVVLDDGAARPSEPQAGIPLVDNDAVIDRARGGKR